jgi:hypothetical protein
MLVNAAMVKQVLACQWRLEQKSMKPTMPWVCPRASSDSGFKTILSKKLTMQESFVDPML